MKIPLSIPIINGNEWRYVKDCLDEGLICEGKYLKLFEEKIQEYTGANFAIACSSGTAALHLSLIVAGIKENDEVIVPTVTFIASINAIHYVKAKPIFMDCDQYYNLDVKKVQSFFEKECFFHEGVLYNKKSQNKIVAILPVHVFGNPVNLDLILNLAEEYNLKIIEDAAESLGSMYKGRKTGTFGDFGCFSFNGNKLITSAGGGMVVTNSKESADKIRYLIDQAKDDSFNFIHKEIGYNYRLSNIHAAIGLAQLENIEERILIKRRNFEIYQKYLKGTDLEMLEEPENSRSNYWFYVLKLGASFKKSEILEKLKKEGIMARPMWYLNHLQIPFVTAQNYNIVKAQELLENTINVPCSINLKEEDIKTVCNIIKLKN
ncbi:MAG: LegC family aminotransferase [Lutibacter sp.]|nr:LegC family aminotransferase [Lutibacter sp.]